MLNSGIDARCFLCLSQLSNFSSLGVLFHWCSVTCGAANPGLAFTVSFSSWGGGGKVGYKALHQSVVLNSSHAAGNMHACLAQEKSTS